MRRTMLAALLLSALAGTVPPAAADTCNPHVWFIGVVSDIEQGTGEPREDFALDVDNFEIFRSRLQQTYCFPDSHVKIFAFKNGYSRNGVDYPTASEGEIKSQIADFGEQASAFSDSMFFFFLSSHGIAYPRYNCPNGRRAGGSLSALWPGGGADGDLYDCELGDALNRAFPPTTRMVIANDCSLCGGFSDSLTAASGTAPDLSLPTPSGIVAPNRVVITGCAVTTECFGGDEGAIMYGHMRRVLDAGLGRCDGWTAPGFPAVQGIDVPRQDGPRDGVCGISEWFYASVDHAYDARDELAIQQQFRMKYGFATLAEDIALF